MMSPVKYLCIAAALVFNASLSPLSHSTEKDHADITLSSQRINATVNENGAAKVHLQTIIKGMDKKDLLIRCVIRETATGKEVAVSRTFQETGRCIGKDSLYTVTVTQDMDMQENVRTSTRYEAITDLYVRARPPKIPAGVRIQMIPAQEIYCGTYRKTFKFKIN